MIRTAMFRGGMICLLFCAPGSAGEVLLDVDSPQVLSIPPLSPGPPAAGCRVAVRAPEFSETDVFHIVYLPPEWSQTGASLPIIFEYTGNFHPASGSTGEPEGAGLGYGLSAGRCIWVSLPYVSPDGQDNAVTWWGNETATIDYAKLNVPRMIREFHADPGAVILCGFSRGAIGTSYLGLHDDEVSQLWTAFVAHDHFDGVRPWGTTTWGTPLEMYRKGAAERLKRIQGRPFLVSQDVNTQNSRQFIQTVLPSAENFTFVDVDVKAIFGSFPHPVARSAHTDRWLLQPCPERKVVWTWMNAVFESAGRERQPRKIPDRRPVPKANYSGTPGK
ncbi:MAG: hypothetical protein R3C49_05035 [Planctomycetaceae bacterium]